MITLPAGFSLSRILAASDSVDAATVQREPYASRITQAVALLDRAARAMNRTPDDLVISSVLRSPDRNEEVGGSQYSHHLSGYAVDFNVRGVAPSVVFEALKPLHSVLKWDELAVYDSHVHLSADPRARGKVLDLRRKKPSRPGEPSQPAGSASLAGLVLLGILGLIGLLLTRGADAWT